MNNQILLGLVTIGLVASVVGVGTYAYFSDTEVSEGNTFAAGTNVFPVPDSWNTTAMQLTTDYPLILDISYTDISDNIVTYAVGDPAESSFDITMGMTITITASEAFDMQ